MQTRNYSIVVTFDKRVEDKIFNVTYVASRAEVLMMTFILLRIFLVMANASNAYSRLLLGCPGIKTYCNI